MNQASQQRTQTPSYLLIGNGRAAQHMQFYFQSLTIPFNHWARKHNTPLQPLLQNSTHVLLLISDIAIDSFIQQTPALSQKTIIHFSGALSTPRAHSAHPLISFSQSLFDKAFYPTIPFIIESEGPAFEELLPGLPNPHWTIPRAQKPFYHSLAVLSGNFSTLLWQKLFTDLEKKLNIPKEAAYPYLQSIAYNLQQGNHSALTGPLARGDNDTLTQNLKALKGDIFESVFQAFMDAYQKQRQQEKI
jgi:2-dehydropantoate 2-reductase